MRCVLDAASHAHHTVHAMSSHGSWHGAGKNVVCIRRVPKLAQHGVSTTHHTLSSLLRHALPHPHQQHC
jgi:hypothetical protein